VQGSDFALLPEEALKVYDTSLPVEGVLVF
jgi:hypothetical protein